MEYQLHTDFASPERSDQNILQWEIEYFKNMNNLTYFLDVVPNIVTVLNQNRQIVFANRTFAEALGYSSPEPLYGKRPGEALDCIYSSLNDAGCGTSRFCRSCQAVNSILTSIDGSISSSECTIIRNGNKGSLELRVHAHPFHVNNSKYVVFSVTDISHEKRRRVLERSFFHDIGNSLTGVMGYAEMLNSKNIADANEWVKKMLLCVNEAVDELFSQKTILLAEDGELHVQKSTIKSMDMIQSVKNVFDSKNSTDLSKIVIDGSSQNISFTSDRPLLARVLINAVKNALEASGNENITISCQKNYGTVSFCVSNPQFIHEDVQTQIFKRSFSTKGIGRGLGTYSMKLLTERYLSGRVSFISTKNSGTSFFIEIPEKS